MNDRRGVVPTPTAAGASPESVPPAGFLRSAQWWRPLGLSLGVALLSAVGALVFVSLVGTASDMVWADGPTSAELFTGSPLIVVIMTLAGIVVGLIYRYVPSTGAPDVFAAVVGRRLDPRLVAGGLLVALSSLIGGFSLWPEVPTGMLAGGTATAVADRRGWDETTRKVTLTSSVGAAYVLLFTSPFVATMFLLELARSRDVRVQAFLGIDVARRCWGSRSSSSSAASLVCCHRCRRRTMSWSCGTSQWPPRSHASRSGWDCSRPCSRRCSDASRRLLPSASSCAGDRGARPRAARDGSAVDAGLRRLDLAGNDRRGRR